ncbi:hypothetical protein C942_03724 [Photobacterium marinum]|uniref:Uncharacterized protein n=1 Tax=Photobacterium marinum TaxID=1056511 RepID=L8JFT7_9GAMM|nr:hypothetical protein C942_03724 [Photobacterium marinum]
MSSRAMIKMEVAKTGTGSRTQRRAARAKMASSRCWISVSPSIGMMSMGSIKIPSGIPKAISSLKS